MRRMLARMGRLLLVLAVLLAQQTALAHQYWHASKAAADSSQPAKGDKLCDLHDLLGTVLGLAASAPAEPQFLALSEPGFGATRIAVREARHLAAHSRDPPERLLTV
jgi:methionine-rich copper-binding protein CopC